MMRATESSAPVTVLDRLIEHLRAKDVAIDGQERPVAILWTDPKAEWRAVIELVQARVDELLVLGPYRPEARTGPAIWIRCLVDRALDSPALAADRPPIVYLPEVTRQDLRAGDECPDGLKPLVELMFQGAMWLQPNGSDWGVTTFLTSSRALGLDIARDAATTEALLGALREVALTPVAQLGGKRLDADDFNRMLAADVIRDILRWMCDPAGTKARLGANGWAAFRSRCREDLGFDPESGSDVEAGALLGRGEDAWEAVWERFIESPTSYAEIVRVLRRSRPAHEMAFERDRWPDLNDQDEDAARQELLKVGRLPHAEACRAILDLEQEHGRRRSWVWARLGLSPMAEVLGPLAQLATSARTALGGTTPDDVASAYLERGWQADAATWEAIAAAPAADEKPVGNVVRALLLPWLEDSARAFQAAIERMPLPGRGAQPSIDADDDGCVVFVDGLRFDLGERLAERLEGRGCRVTVGRRWAALPTVTGTAKPAATPVADVIAGERLGADFAPRIQPGARQISAEHLRHAIRDRGYQMLGDGAFDVPASHHAKGWLEAGDIDSLGHTLGARLARQIDDELGRLAERVSALLDAGWKTVRVVTDHGWLLVPGGLPKVDLPRHLTETRWSRCAVMAGTSAPQVPVAPWHWNASESFATAPGIACFKRSEEYAHGGLSIQECLVPDLSIERAGEAVVTAVIRSITWRGLRCFVEASVRGGVVLADLRLGRPSGVSVAAATKPVEADSAVSLVLSSDEQEEASLVVVLVGEAGQVLAQKATRVGEDS